MKNTIIISILISLPLTTYIIGSRVADQKKHSSAVYMMVSDAHNQINDLKGKCQMLEHVIKNNMYAIDSMGNTLITLTDGMNILGNHYNLTSGNEMVPVIIDGEDRLILK